MSWCSTKIKKFLFRIVGDFFCKFFFIYFCLSSKMKHLQFYSDSSKSVSKHRKSEWNAAKILCWKTCVGYFGLLPTWRFSWNFNLHSGWVDFEKIGRRNRKWFDRFPERFGFCIDKTEKYGKDISAHRDDKSQKLTEDLRLTCDSEIEILPNDFLKVQHQSQEFELVAGVAFNYPTHKEISVRRRKEAGQ